MAHYAFLDKNNVVIEVITGIDETELIEGLDTETWYGNFRGQVCKRTSYNGNIRKQYAGIGFNYDSVADVFVAPQPYPSWLLDENFDWQAPKPMPKENLWLWDEATLSWVEIEPLTEQHNPSRQCSSMTEDIFPITRTIDDQIDDFENIGVLLKEKNGFKQATHCQFNCSNSS